MDAPIWRHRRRGSLEFWKHSPQPQHASEHYCQRGHNVDRMMQAYCARPQRLLRRARRPLE
jgi:hypothetical protein